MIRTSDIEAAKALIMRALELAPEDVERIDLVIRLAGKAGQVALTYEVPVTIVDRNASAEYGWSFLLTMAKIGMWLTPRLTPKVINGTPCLTGPAVAVADPSVNSSSQTSKEKP